MNEDVAVSLLHQLLQLKRLNDVQELVFRLSWQGKTYRQIAEESDYDEDYIRDIGFRLWRSLSVKLNTKVTKKNIHSILTDYLTHHRDAKQTSIAEEAEVFRRQFHDWGEAIDTKIFYGRDRELQDLKNWVLTDQCRLVGVFGIGGVGKTAFAAKLARTISGEFDYLIWRSLSNAPQIDTILVDIISFLSHQQETAVKLPQDIDHQIRKLLKYLRYSRCLIILDNLESILQSCAGTYDGREGCYRDGYDGFGQFLSIVADTEHQSCLLVTGREIPITFWSRNSVNSANRYLQLTGLNLIEARKLIKQQISLKGSKLDSTEAKSDYRRDKLINYYGGNPLALKIVSATIREIFNSNLTEFWQTNVGIFGDINDLLQQQCDRLSILEIDIMYWLALEKDSVTIPQLQDKLLERVSLPELLTAIQSLKQRSLIEKTKTGFTLQPVIREFFSEKFSN